MRNYWGLGEEGGRADGVATVLKRRDPIRLGPKGQLDDGVGGTLQEAQGWGELLAVKTKVGVLLSGITGQWLVVDRSHMPVVRQMPFLLQGMEDLGSLPQDKEHKSKTQQPADRLSRVPASHDQATIPQRRAAPCECDLKVRIEGRKSADESNCGYTNRTNRTLSRRVVLSVPFHGAWRSAAMDSSNTKYSWKLFSYMWNGATPGEHTLVSRVTDENGNVQRESLDEKMTGLENHAQFPRTVMIG